MERNKSKEKTHFSESERYEIWKLLQVGYNFNEISKEIGRDPTTIWREVKRYQAAVSLTKKLAAVVF